MREFLLDRVRLVRELLASDIQVAYADVVLILCCVISAAASRRWPGERIDRRRFVELLVQHSPPDAHADWVCVPALINRGLLAEADTPYGPGGNTRIFRDEEIDLPLSSAETTYPQVQCRELRNCSYAALIYTWLRCGYAHDYCAHENITHVPASRRSARVSYIGRGTRTGIRRMVSFHLDYLVELAEHHANTVPDVSSPHPSVWWLDMT